MYLTETTTQLCIILISLNLSVGFNINIKGNKIFDRLKWLLYYNL